jgi:hypothetical protein
MTRIGRELLKNRRRHIAFDFEHDYIKHSGGAGFFPDGRLAELFLTCSKPGSAVGIAARDGAIAISLALQFGARLDDLRHAMTRLPDGRAAGPICAALDIIADSLNGEVS